LLVAHGADVNLPDNEKKSALMWSAHHGSTAILEFLLDNGGDLALIDCFGDNIRQYARTARRNREKTLAILAKRGVKRLPYCYGYSLRTTCPRCGHPVPVNGPLQCVPCAACGSSLPLDEGFWTHVFETACDAGASVTSFGGAGVELDYRRMNPVCPACKAGFDASLVEPGTDGTFSCPACGAVHATFPVPEWMEDYTVKGKHPFQVYCALERDGQAVSEPPGGAEAVVIRCASCAAALTIDRETARSAVCTHCGVTQYLPDPLWRALHPVRTREWWYLRFR
jgi:Zn finger protein HypA/HybF involved in hydrogenase expression